MDYFRLFNLEKEPFANTPDPDFFYRSAGHAECLQKLELAVRLRRGLCIVCGEVGTGKTTICRQLIRTLSEDNEMEVHLVLDPGYAKVSDFAADINSMISGRQESAGCSGRADHREMIKNSLFKKGVDLGKTVVLIIDEGQKLTRQCAEFLRELLNYETNQHKLVQIIIFAQKEIGRLLEAHPGFADRVALYHRLGPLSVKETARLISHRLEKSGGGKNNPSAPYFTSRAVSKIYRISRGHPRTVIHIAHHVLLLMLIKGTGRATPSIVKQAASGLPGKTSSRFSGSGLRAAVFSAASAGLALAVIGAYASWPVSTGKNNHRPAGTDEKQMVVTDQNKEDGPAMAAGKEPDPEETGKHRLPETLGRVTISKNDRLWPMAARIYNTPDPRIPMEKIFRANPGLKDPRLLHPGQKIVFPAPGPEKTAQEQRYRLAWKKSENLEPVYRFASSGGLKGLEVISYWHPDSGMEHAAVGEQSFAGQAQAEQKIRTHKIGNGAEPFVLDLGKEGLRVLNSFKTNRPN
ncbi:MAG: AAA family ATPase [Desulfosalsimonas sp.]